MKHQIIVRYSNRADRSLPLTLHLRKCIAAALEAEHVNVPCEINVLVTDDAGIRAINRAMRNIDRETDVLSFPMFQFTPGQFPEDVQEDIDPQTGLLPLGDMAISLERARDQAKRFGNSLRRETGYLTIHSILHLLGGFGYMPGCIAGGLVLGIVENIASMILPSVYKDVVAFVLLVAFLLFRPQGLLGKKNK